MRKNLIAINIILVTNSLIIIVKNMIEQFTLLNIYFYLFVFKLCNKLIDEINHALHNTRDFLVQLILGYPSFTAPTFTLRNAITRFKCLCLLPPNIDLNHSLTYTYFWAHNVIPEEYILFLQFFFRFKKDILTIL